MSFPVHRGRRLRRTPALRALAQETRLAPAQLVAPLFVRDGQGLREPIASMPGHARLSPDVAAREAAALAALGVGAVLLFGIPDAKDAGGSARLGSRRAGAAGHRAHSSEAAPDLSIWADVCLCEYTDHGHCGVLDDGVVDNDATLPLLARAAVAYAVAGADVIAPSDMMDGRVGAIRAALDDAGCAQTAIVSYAVKYASAFYGPFREAAGSTPQTGDRRGYQMDPPNVREAIREALADVDEGADMVMVKPGLPYLDVIRAVRERVDVPVVAYQVSGEFAMLRAAAERGWVDLPRAAYGDGARAATRRCRPAHHLLRPRAGRDDRRAVARRRRTGTPMTSTPSTPTATWFERARRVTPGGVHSPVRAFAAMHCDPIAVLGRAARTSATPPAAVHRLHRRVGAGAPRPRASRRRAGRGRGAPAAAWSSGSPRRRKSTWPSASSRACRAARWSASSSPAPRRR